MWPQTFEERLVEWKNLRTQAQDLAADVALLQINQWWWTTPQVNHYMHWDDWRSWPGPWDLLADNIYCDLARALGIVYTIMMIPQFDHVELQLAKTNDGNLVLVNDRKYILNYCPGDIVNIGSECSQIQDAYDSALFRHLIG